MSTVERRLLRADLVIVGGGTAGCMAALVAKRLAPQCRVVVMEKAHVERSGCLAAGLNAINAYLRPGEDPQRFVDFVSGDNADLVREDLVYSIAERLWRIPETLEAWGVSFPHAADGGYVFRGPRSIVMHGERLKPILAARLKAAGVQVLNRVAATGYVVTGDAIRGVCGMGARDGSFYTVEAPAVITATGGATGLYPACNGEYARNRTWYPPFNAGAGYAMGIRAGAEMTSFEIRFVPLRVKDVFAPTGTVAQGVNAPQVNALGVQYLRGGGRLGTAGRLALTLEEDRLGRGPCYLDLSSLSPQDEAGLRESYLHMCPSILLHWADRGVEPHEGPLELAASEPCLVGGHTQAGYWIGVDRSTTLSGLFAAGDVAGGSPKKYVSGALIEGELAAVAALSVEPGPLDRSAWCQAAESEYARATNPLLRPGPVTPRTLLDRLQKITEEYAGGRTSGYRTCETRLKIAAELLDEARLLAAPGRLGAESPHDLMRAHEAIDRLEVARVMVAHLRHRTETRWPVYQERADHPDRNDVRWRCFVNSRTAPDGTITIVERTPSRQVVEVLP